MQAVDDYIPTPERAIDQPFLMPIEDVFGIKGRGTVVTGRIERGLVKTGDEIEIVGLGERRKVVVTGVEMFQKTLDAGAGRATTSGCLLRGVERDDVQRGQVLASRAAIKPHTKFQAEVYVLGKEEGGRHTPFFPGYRPQFYIRTTDVTGHDRAAGGGGDGDAGGQHPDGGGADHAGGDRGGVALRDSRRRPHRRRRRRHLDHRVSTAIEAEAGADEWSHAKTNTEDPHPPEGIRSPDPRPVGRARSWRRRSRPARRWRARCRCRPGSRSSA